MGGGGVGGRDTVSIPTFHRTHESHFGELQFYNAGHHHRGQAHKHVRKRRQDGRRTNRTHRVGARSQGWRSVTESSWTLWHTGGPCKDTGTPVPLRREAQVARDTLHVTPRFAARRLGYQQTRRLRLWSDELAEGADTARRRRRNYWLPSSGLAGLRIISFPTPARPLPTRAAQAWRGVATTTSDWCLARARAVMVLAMLIDRHASHDVFGELHTRFRAEGAPGPLGRQIHGKAVVDKLVKK